MIIITVNSKNSVICLIMQAYANYFELRTVVDNGNFKQ